MSAEGFQNSESPRRSIERDLGLDPDADDEEIDAKLAALKDTEPEVWADIGSKVDELRAGTKVEVPAETPETNELSAAEAEELRFKFIDVLTVGNDASWKLIETTFDSVESNLKQNITEDEEAEMRVLAKKESSTLN
jgi:hypothetical protein